jgi:hypothetical protein
MDPKKHQGTGSFLLQLSSIIRNKNWLRSVLYNNISKHMQKSTGENQ